MKEEWNAHLLIEMSEAMWETETKSTYHDHTTNRDWVGYYFWKKLNAA